MALVNFIRWQLKKNLTSSKQLKVKPVQLFKSRALIAVSLLIKSLPASVLAQMSENRTDSATETMWMAILIGAKYSLRCMECNAMIKVDNHNYLFTNFAGKR